MKRILIATLSVLVIALAAVPMTVFAASNTGAHGFGKVSVEPAYDGRSGQEVFILLPDNAKVQPTSAWSPLYLVMYPTSATLGTLDCTPQNCDHANAIPDAVLSSLADEGINTPYSSGSVSTPYGDFTGGLVKGHDHLLTTDTQGHMHVTKHVYFALFTTNSGCDGAWNTEVTTAGQLNSEIANGCIVTVDTGLMVHASMVSGATYAHHAN